MRIIGTSILHLWDSKSIYIKMKTGIFILLIFLLTSCFTLIETTAPKSGEIIEVKGTKDELFIRSNQWMVKAFTNGKSVIQSQDKQTGKIIGKYLLHGEFGIQSQYGFIQQSPDAFALITIIVKDNTAQIVIEPQGSWKSIANGRKVGYGDKYGYTSERAQEDLRVLINSYKDYIPSNINLQK